MLVKNSADEDREIVQRVLAGDSSAFAELVRKYQDKVMRHCFAMLSNSSDAEDAAQEVFVKAFRGLRNFKSNSAFSTWLFRITANHCTDELRRSARARTVGWESLTRPQLRLAEASSAMPADVAVPVEQAQLLKLVLAELPREQREVLLLRELYGLSYEEIARSTNCTVDSVKARLRRVREKLDTVVRGRFDLGGPGDRGVH